MKGFFFLGYLRVLVISDRAACAVEQLRGVCKAADGSPSCLSEGLHSRGVDDTRVDKESVCVFAVTFLAQGGSASPSNCLLCSLRYI